MKLMVASDIHGSVEAVKQLIEKFKMHKADKLIILGDIYQGYKMEDSLEIMRLLSDVITKVYLLRGNCDSPFLENISPIGMHNNLVLKLDQKTIYFNHGDKGMPNVDFSDGDIYCCGHTHIQGIKKYHHIIICNPGSTTLPRAGSKASYMIITSDTITIYDFFENIIDQLKE